MTKAEHIASYFESPPANSLLSGVAPADVHNRDPRKLSLVSAGATVLGDGVLAQAENANVVFYQFPPYTVTKAQGEAPSLLVDGQDALEGKQSALVTLGMTAGGGVQFGQSVKVAPQLGKTYTFAVSIKGIGGPVLAHLEVERAGSPWDRAVKGDNVLIPENQWTEMHVTFKCQKPFPEGWQAYVGCARRERGSEPTCSGCTKGTTCLGRLPRHEQRRRARPRLETFSSIPALRPAKSHGFSCSTSNST